MNRSLRATIFLALLICLFRAAYHVGQAIQPFPIEVTRLVSAHIDDAIAYGILALFFCYIIYCLRPKK